MALFSEKYGKVVRVVKVPGFSMELCAGSHVSNIGQIGMFKILSETGVAAGVRRIEAVTGRKALEYARTQMDSLQKVAADLKCHTEDVPAHVESLISANKEMENELKKFNEAREKADAQKLLAGIKEIGSVHLIAGKSSAKDMDELREVSDFIISKAGENALIVLAAVNDGKVSIVVRAGDGAVKSGIHAGKIIKEAAKVVGGGGGGRPNMAQAGGKDPSKLSEAFTKAEEVAKAQISE